MLNREDVYEIRYLYKAGYSERAIAEQLSFSRNTVRRYLKEYRQDQKTLQSSKDKKARRMAQERIENDPQYAGKGKSRCKYKYTDAIDKLLDKILADEAKKTDRKQKLSCKQIHELIVAEGHDIGLTTITSYIRQKRDKTGEVFIQQDYDYGYRVEFDYGQTKINIAGKKTTVFLAVIAAPRSGYRQAYLYRNAKIDTFVDAQVKFFEQVGGVYDTVVYDNMKNVVSRFVGKTDKLITPTAQKLSDYYGFRIVLTNTRKGNEKGTVENAVRWVRSRSFAYRQDFDSFEEAQAYLKECVDKLNENCTIEEERKHLKPCPCAYESADYSERKVNKYSFVRIDNNDYSVPEQLVGKTVTVKLYPNDVAIYYKNELLVETPRLCGKNKARIDINHYLHTLLKKPGALKNSKALKSVPELKVVFDRYYTEKPREFIRILMDNKDTANTEELVELLDPTKIAKKQQGVITFKTIDEIDKVKNMFK